MDAQPLPERGAGVAVTAVFDEPRPQLRFRIRLLVERDRRYLRWPRQDRSALDEDQLRSHGHEPGHAPEPVALERDQSIEVRLRQPSERHGQNVELAGFDESEQESQRAVEVARSNMRGRLEPASVEDDLGRGAQACKRGSACRSRARIPLRRNRFRCRHQFASSAAYKSRPGSSTGFSCIRINSTVCGLQPASAAMSAERSAWCRSRSKP